MIIFLAVQDCKTKKTQLFQKEFKKYPDQKAIEKAFEGEKKVKLDMVNKHRVVMATEEELIDMMVGSGDNNGGVRDYR